MFFKPWLLFFYFPHFQLGHPPAISLERGARECWIYKKKEGGGPSVELLDPLIRVIGKRCAAANRPSTHTRGDLLQLTR